MKRCNPNAWAQCPDRHHCEPYAEFADGSQCDNFNEGVKVIEPILLDVIKRYRSAIQKVQALHDNAKGVEKSMLAEILALFGEPV